MGDKLTITGGPTSYLLTLSSSFVTKVEDKSLPGAAIDLQLAGFYLGKGGWIVQAKATIRTNMPDHIDIQFRLASTEGSTTVSDKAKASAENFGYASLVAVLGVHVSTVARIELHVTKQGLAGADVTDIVITAIHQDSLTIGAM